jgi:hypothetical protein
MEHLIQCLKSLNSKERFFLLGHVFDNPAFLIAPNFRSELKDILGIKIPEDAFAAMDYHLDWLYASLIWAEDYEKKGETYRRDEIIKGTQEDIDFLIAFDDAKTDISHIIFIEAKGVTGWDEEQMKSKQKRLKNIFGAEGNRYDLVIPHFIMISPKPPENDYPEWKWLLLPVPEKLNKVTRCTECGKNDINGTHWKIVERKY